MFYSQVLSFIPAETVSGLEGDLDTSINKNVSDIEDSEKITFVGKETKFKFCKTLKFFKLVIKIR